MAKRPDPRLGRKNPRMSRAKKSPMESKTTWHLFARCHGDPVEQAMIESKDAYGRPVRVESGEHMPRVLTSIQIAGVSFDSKGWVRVQPPPANPDLENAMQSGFGAGRESGTMAYAKGNGKPLFNNGKEAEALRVLTVLVQASPYLECKRFDCALDRIPLPEELMARWRQIEDHAEAGIQNAMRFDGLGSADRVQFYKGQKFESLRAFWRSLAGLPKGWLPAEFERMIRLEVGTAAEAVGVKEVA